MKTKTKNRLRKVLVGITIIFLLSSCHSKYLSIEIKTDGTIAWNKDSSEFAFIAETRLYRMPVGIARFPDGGMTKSEYLDFSLYHYNIKHKKLTHLINLNEFYLPSAYRWLSISQINLSLKDSLLFYKLRKPYDHNMKYIDKKRKPDYLKDISKTYSVNIRTSQKSVVDTTIIKNIFNHKRERFQNSSAKDYLSGLKYSDWGINLKELYPQSKSTYLGYIINGGNTNMLEAIFEQIAPDFTEKDKKYIIAEMIKTQKHLLDEYNKRDREKDPYQKALKRDLLKHYTNYIVETKKKLNFPVRDNKKAEQEKVLKRLKDIGLNIPDDFKFTKLNFIGQGYEAAFKLKEADSVNIEKYKNWFYRQVASLRRNNWEVDQGTKRYGRPNSAGIIVHDEITFIWEHTELKLRDKNGINFLDLGIDYNINKDKSRAKFLTFDISEEHETNK